MTHVFKLSSLLLVMMIGCAFWIAAQSPTTAAAQASTATAAPTGDAEFICPVTPTKYDQPAKDPNADPFGFGDYYISADRAIWTGPISPEYPWTAGGNKVLWIRPQGTDLVVTGHRLDAKDAAPMHADLPCCYPTGFQASGLIFPSAGCWDITAKSGNSDLHFVTKVEPNKNLKTDDISCDALADAVKGSYAIIVGQIIETASEGHYRWHNVRLIANWRLPPGINNIGDRVNVLQDADIEPELKQGSQYILFLRNDLWQIACPQRSIIERKGNDAVAVGKQSFWAGGTANELYKEIDSYR